MNLYRKCVSGALALTLAAGMAGSAFAATNDGGDVDVEITPKSTGGVLSVSITDLDFGTFEYSLSQRTPTGMITINASDMRGTAGGWTVKLSGDDFATNDTTPLSFDIENLSLPAGTVNHVGAPSGHPTSAVPLLSAASPVTAAPQVVLNALPGTGAGIYENQRPGTQLVIPGGTLVGDYQSTLTVEITGDQP